jgi:hypothetical protein
VKAAIVCAMSTTADRLAAYIAAEAEILSSQTARFGDRLLTLPDLAEVRAAITQLQAQLRRERMQANRRPGFAPSVSDFSGSEAPHGCGGDRFRYS